VTSIPWRNCFHLCVDMQNLFRPGSPWETPWMERVLPRVLQLAEAWPERCIFTRFIPPQRPGEGVGCWKEYFEHWAAVTQEALPPDAVELLAPLARLSPPARVVDKGVYNPWAAPALEDMLREAKAEAVILSGTETDVCVLGGVLGAVDRGYKVVLARDAVCSSTDATHDAVLTVLSQRYGRQVEVMPVEDILAAWLPHRG
jgi:nicotinamidase-related amidase